MLGEALTGQQRYADAEPLLLAAYQELKQDAAEIAPQAKARVTEALQRIVDLYIVTGQHEKAVEWRAKLEAEQPKQPEGTP